MNKILKLASLGIVVAVLIFVIIYPFKYKEAEVNQPKYHLEYIVDTLSSVCIVIIHQHQSPIGITEVDCILVPAGKFKIIEEGSYVGN